MRIRPVALDLITLEPPRNPLVTSLRANFEPGGTTMNKTARTRTLTALTALAALSLSSVLAQSSLAQSSRPVVVSSGCAVKGAIERFTALLSPTRYSSAANWSGYQNAGWTPPRGYRHVT